VYQIVTNGADLDAAEITEHGEIRRQEQNHKQNPVGIYLSIAKNAEGENRATLDSKKSPRFRKHRGA
jgi:hypothetical protein